MPLPHLPAFATLSPSQSGTELDDALAKNRSELNQLLAQCPHSYASLIEPLDEMGERLSRAWGPVSHLFGVMSTPEWRAVFNVGLPKITEYSVEVSQNQALYQAYAQLAEQPAFAHSNPVQQKVVHDALRDFRLSGIALPEAQKARFKAISLKLSELQSQFEEHVMDCVQAWQHLVTDEAELLGVADAAKQAAAAKASAKGLNGWLLTLDFPSYDAIASRCQHRPLRERLYQAYATRASREGGHDVAFDNTEIMQQILALRHEEAQLLGFANFAELSLATKMADSPAEVESFLLELAAKARPYAETELAALKQLAADDGVHDLQPWDSAFYSERLREAQLGISDEALRPYLPFPQVLQGLYDLIQRLYGVSIQPLPTAPTWHPDASAWQLLNAQNQVIGAFYLDPYTRPETKRGGAWMDECLGRRCLPNGLQLPVAYLVCNFTPPAPGQPALITFDEVTTLYHEFGHGLHHLLTQVEESNLAGIHGVEWDAVELPSQFMENFCYEPSTLQSFARHWQTGAAMPLAMINTLKADRRFQAGLATLRQIEFSLFDLRLHRDYQANTQALEILAQVRSEVAVSIPPAYNRMPWSFGHIFGGGYAAGYYSYKWAEVLSSDAYAAFEETQFSAETSASFLRNILSAGGSRTAMDNFVAFRGRKPTVDALLRHSGLTASPVN